MTLPFISTPFCIFKSIHNKQNSLKKVRQFLSLPNCQPAFLKLMTSGSIRRQSCVENGLVRSVNELAPPTGTPREAACPLLAMVASGEVGNGGDFESER